jgi:hypothetical protein
VDLAVFGNNWDLKRDLGWKGVWTCKELIGDGD